MNASDLSELEWAQKILEAVEYPTVIELGACRGEDSRTIYNWCHPEPRIYLAVEPDPRHTPILRQRMVSKIGFRIIEAAIAAHIGDAVLHLSDGLANDGNPGFASSSIRAPKQHLRLFPGINFDEKVTVPAYTLDHLANLHGIDQVDLIWCDIQGAERDMIAGGQKTLARTRYLLAEADRCEMYEGQAQRDELVELLPQFRLIAEWPENADLLFLHV